ncbi:3-dehydrosphinganine reductase TSC10B [Prunus dulcis]|uniref:3-dehydrosphinganine reductase n=1 Tax=Prunus dulcis TaxID=3755 RepID=A0A4Y1RNG7_PRUDU|nr:3-dehydrosphinganine reductase TSC10B [Prunus dulcis]
MQTPSMAYFNLSFLALLLLLLPPLALLLILYLIVRPRPVKIPIKNRHVFITGGSSGIGLALAHQAASEGARVSILARSIDKLEEAKKYIQLSTGIDVSIFSADVRDYDAVSKAVEEADPIDVLIVNQGVFVPEELEKQGLDEVKFMVDVNLIGSFNMIKAALPKMKKGDSIPRSIALMSSQAGQVGIYGYTAYSASKFGLRGLAEALQQEVISHDIHVSLIFPPDTDTPGLTEEMKKRPQLSRIIAESSGMMKAEEVAKKAFKGIKSAAFIVPCNLEGALLSIATAGMSPQRSFVMAFVEVVAAGLVRLVALFFQWNWYNGIHTGLNLVHCKGTSYTAAVGCGILWFFESLTFTEGGFGYRIRTEHRLAFVPISWTTGVQEICGHSPLDFDYRAESMGSTIEY